MGRGRRIGVVVEGMKLDNDIPMEGRLEFMALRSW